MVKRISERQPPKTSINYGQPTREVQKKQKDKMDREVDNLISEIEEGDISEEEVQKVIKKKKKKLVPKPNDYDKIIHQVREFADGESFSITSNILRITKAFVRANKFFDVQDKQIFIQRCVQSLDIVHDLDNVSLGALEAIEKLESEKANPIDIASPATGAHDLLREMQPNDPKERPPTITGAIQSNQIIKSAKVRWLEDESTTARDFYLSRIKQDWQPKRIYQIIADSLGRSFLSVKQKIERMRNLDPEMLEFKYSHWSKENIVGEIQILYIQNEDLNRKNLPVALRSQIANHSKPKCDSLDIECYFKSFDDAVAEALFEVGIKRDVDGKFVDDIFIDHSDALQYYRRFLKKTHKWSKEEMLGIISEAHKKGLPVTKHFFARYAELYKKTLGLNRSLEGFKYHVKKYFSSWGSMLNAANIIDEQFYDDKGNLKMSSEEAYVAKFLEKNNIRYRRCDLKDKIKIVDQDILDLGYKHFVPDFYLLSENNDIDGVVEVFGSIADMKFVEKNNLTTGELYREKREAKIYYLTILFGNKFIAIDANEEKNDLFQLDQKFENWMP